jgi:hypothetical protein
MLIIVGSPPYVGSLLLILGYNPITVGLYKSMPDLGLPDGSVESSKPHLEKR